ncbi:MAG: polysaccharide biosynthesis/export family protein [Syntrophotaleaceae bacterium]
MRKLFPVLVLVLLNFLSPIAWCEDYIIGDGDVLLISVWGVPELTVEVIVRPDGKITLPAGGDIVASGLSPAQLSEKLNIKLSEFVKKPVVTVTVRQIVNNRVYVSGGGAGPTVVDLTGRTTLLKLLCRLEGLQNADLRRAYIIREGNRIDTDFYQLFVKGDVSRDVTLQPEDIIFLPTQELNKVYVTGAIQEPRYIFYREGMTVLDAILEAGGFSEYAKQNDVLVLRHGGEKIELRIKDLMSGKNTDHNVALQPGDQVVVKEGMF